MNVSLSHWIVNDDDLAGKWRCCLLRMTRLSAAATVAASANAAGNHKDGNQRDNDGNGHTEAGWVNIYSFLASVILQLIEWTAGAVRAKAVGVRKEDAALVVIGAGQPFAVSFCAGLVAEETFAAIRTAAVGIFSAVVTAIAVAVQFCLVFDAFLSGLIK